MKIYNNKIRNKKIVKESFVINLFLQNIYSSAVVIKFSIYNIIIGASLI